MLCSKYISFSFLLFSLFLHAVNCTDPLYHFCFSQENYTANSPYGTNLNGLLKILSTKVSSKGFGLSSTGQGQAQANGLALCRGDVSKTNCKTCVIDAGKELGDRCPYKKGAIIWYDNCLLKYSNIDFFGEIDNKNKLSNKAYANPKFYATGDLKLDSSSKLYGLAQCTRDLSGLDCKKCLDTAISELPNCCDGKRGGRVVVAVVTLDMNFTPLLMLCYFMVSTVYV
ncbi:cysteine-rich repeat secretory protein 38 [Quercus suber]|uniref:Cysteine-rich repeat secretory protein 38 n=1 Tax=Quercus suber TaxID=58331 RepID=A0AAW0LKM5_QUESU